MRSFFGSSIGVVLALSLSGCHAEQRNVQSARSAPPLPNMPARPAFDPTPPRVAEGQTLELQPGAIRGAATVRTSTSTGVLAGLAVGSRGTSHAAHAALPNVDGSRDAASKEKLELEAQLAIEVKDVGASATGVGALVAENGGRIQKEERTSTPQAHAELLVRVPSERFDAFVTALGRLGEIRNRRVTAVDTTLEHRDLELVVKNLEAAMIRYQELLGKTTDAVQVVTIEKELERVRTELDRVKGRLMWMRDRVAFATIAIALSSPEADPDVGNAGRATLATGVRGLSFIDVREGGTNGYFGAGLSLRLPQAFGDSSRGLVFDVDVLRACCKSHPERSEWAFNVLLGFDLYGSSFHSGRRQYLNPYLGLRAGFSQTQNRGDFAAAAVFGLEIIKTRAFVFDVQARAMALVGNPDGPHAAAVPSLGFDLAF